MQHKALAGFIKGQVMKRLSEFEIVDGKRVWDVEAGFYSLEFES
jgi:hypothetical protein